MIEIKNLVKTFGDFSAVKGISFNVEAGEIFGFLGPNGAGKSTMVKMRPPGREIRLGAVIRMINHNGDCPVNLLKQHHPYHPVRPGHGAEAHQQAGVLAEFRSAALPSRSSSALRHSISGSGEPLHISRHK